ncbi:21652_t:CDS:1 [Rhizophagus irregularis]|nr:21652_t:CDS:1 [Rhizophagus irregularis]
MVQSKISGAINFVFIFTLLIGLVGRVSAHGILLSPTPRLPYGHNVTDIIAKVSNPTKEFPCGIAGDSPGPVTTYKPGEKILIAYNRTITHGGDCLMQISRYGDKYDKDFKTFENLGPCGMEKGLFTAFVEVPYDECDNEDCVMRFRWDDDAGNNYLYCVNVRIKKYPDCWDSKRRRSIGTTRRALKN